MSIYIKKGNDYSRHIDFDNMVSHMILCNVIKQQNGLVIAVKLDSPTIINDSLLNLSFLETIYPLII